MTRLRLAGYHDSADDCGILGPECAIRAWVTGRKHQAPLLAYPTARISLPITLGSGQKTIHSRAEKNLPLNLRILVGYRAYILLQ